MNTSGAGLAAFLLATAFAAKAVAADVPLPHLTVGELVADRDKYMVGEVVVQGHLVVANLWRAFEATHNLYESKAVHDQLGRDWKVITERTERIHGPDEKSADAAQDMLSLQRKYCITVLPVEHFRRGQTYLSDRTVTVKGHLEEYRGLQDCNPESGVILMVDEVLDPPPAKSGRR
ncbi:MAG: hypothetical protein ACXU82_04745 [Caulobacteraceae bacterium]